MDTPIQRFHARMIAERMDQHEKWGVGHDAGHTVDDWALLITKHVGKLADVTLDGPENELDLLDTIRHRLVVIATLCMAYDENIANALENEFGTK